MGKPEELVLVDDIVAMRLEGKSLRAISSQLQQNGTQISHVTVGRILSDSQKSFKLY